MKNKNDQLLDKKDKYMGDKQNKPDKNYRE